MGVEYRFIQKINVAFFRSLLNQYWDKEVCEFLEFGFPIGANSEGVNFAMVDNHLGARSFAVEMGEYLCKELSYGAILGPFEYNPFFGGVFISPLNSVPKKDSDERRVILDLSYPEGQSINDLVDKDWYLGKPVDLKYPRTDDMVNIIKKKGQGCLMFKKDLRRAYRQIPIDPGDFNMICYTWEMHLYVDRVLPMGLRSSAFVCQRITNAVRYMFNIMGFDLLNYLDDLAGAEKPALAVQAYAALERLVRDCGFEEAVGKACFPSTKMIFLGLEYDSVAMTISIDVERLSEILELLDGWSDKSVASLKEVQSLIGKLNFVASCVRPGRVLISRMLTFLRSFSLNKGLKVLTLSSEFRKDVAWWHFAFV